MSAGCPALFNRRPVALLRVLHALPCGPKRRRASARRLRRDHSTWRCPCLPPRDPATLPHPRRVRADNADRINTFIALQFLFDHFWKTLKVSPQKPRGRLAPAPYASLQGSGTCRLGGWQQGAGRMRALALCNGVPAQRTPKGRGLPVAMPLNFPPCPAPVHSRPLCRATLRWPPPLAPHASNTSPPRTPPSPQAYANERGIGLVGDMPIYVGGQSADVWANRDLFELQPDGTPALVRCCWAVGEREVLWRWQARQGILRPGSGQGQGAVCGRSCIWQVKQR